MRGITLLSYFLLSLPVCFVSPFYGILMWAVVSFLNPQSYVWGVATMFPWGVAVAIPTLCGAPLFSRGWNNLACGKVLLIVALGIWFTITSTVSTNSALFAHHTADTWEHWRFVSKVMLMALITMVAVDTLPRLRIYVMTLAGCFGVFVAKALPFALLTGGKFRIYGPERSMIADNNDFGLALNMTLPIFFFLAQTESRRLMRVLYWALFVMTIPTIFFTYSRGAMLGLVVLMSMMIIRLKIRMLLLPVVVLGALIAVLFAPQAWKDRMNPDRAVDASARERFNSWTFSWNLAKDYPLTGGGFATFTPELYARYAPVKEDIRGPHSIYFGLLAEHGFPGLLLYLTLVAACFRTAARLVKQGRAREDLWVVHYANMFRFSLVGFLTSGFFLGRAYFDYFFAIVASLTVLDKLAHAAWAQDEGDVESEELSLSLALEQGVMGVE